MTLTPPPPPRLTRLELHLLLFNSCLFLQESVLHDSLNGGLLLLKESPQKCWYQACNHAVRPWLIYFFYRYPLPFVAIFSNESLCSQFISYRGQNLSTNQPGKPFSYNSFVVPLIHFLQHFQRKYRLLINYSCAVCKLV